MNSNDNTVSVESDCENNMENAEDLSNNLKDVDCYENKVSSIETARDQGNLPSSATNEAHSNEENCSRICGEKEKNKAIDSEADDLTKNAVETQLDEMNLEDKLSVTTPQDDMNKPFVQSELGGEDNLHGLSISSEVCAQPASSNTEDNSIDNDHSSIKTDKCISGDDIRPLTVSKQNHSCTNETVPETERSETSRNAGGDTHDSNDSSSKSVSSKPSTDTKEKLDQEVENMMHKNIEKFSPKKEPKPNLSPQLAKTPDTSGRPRRVNPFNHAEATDELDADIWKMQSQVAPSISLQAMSSYGHQPQPSYKPVNYSTSHHSYLSNPINHSQIPPHYNFPYSQNHQLQFELMPPASRVRPVVDSPTYCEDVDAIIEETKSRNSCKQLEQPSSDPWIRMDQQSNDRSPDNTDSSIQPNDVELPRVHDNSVTASCSSYREHQERDLQSSSSSVEGNRKKDVAPTPPFKEHEEKESPFTSSSLVRPLIEASGPCEPEDLIEGIIFTAHYLGSTQLQSARNPGKNARMMQAQEAVSRIKAPEGESQPSVEVDLFISTNKVKILNADTQETIMDHTLRSISYIADIGKLLVIMAKRRAPQSENQDQNQIVRDPKPQRSYRVICHVFSSHDAQLMAQAIGQAFNVAYQQFLTANGIEPQTLTKDDYNQLLDMQEMYHDDLVHYSKRENIKDLWVEKNKGENLGVVIVESGWGSIVPTVILANLQHGGPAERCGKLSIGDQIMTVNGTSLVGLPLATCQSIIKGLRGQSIARLNIISCPPVVTVLIKRPDLKYQLGFSVQDGIICSLMRGGIAERGGVRVGHRIIEINNQSVVATPHDKIVQTLVSSVGEIQMKTMPAMIYPVLVIVLLMLNIQYSYIHYFCIFS